MPQLVVTGAAMACSFGAAPSVLAASSAPTVTAPTPAATIMDFAPMANIPTFGMCTAPTNPAVIAALGSPVPCVPVTTNPWTPGSAKTTLKGQKALHDASMCMCKWLGVITITSPGQAKTSVV